MRHLDLFSGLGGNSLAADWVWPDVEHIFCEINPFLRLVLAHHWPHSAIYEDIKKLDATALGPIDVLTAGVPCQPASSAGQRKGTGDDRWLWPRTLEVIFAARPRYCILENPPGILTLQQGVPFEDILSTLGANDYETIPINIPACGVETPHERQRVFVVAHDTRERAQWGNMAKQRKQIREDINASGKTRSTPNLVGKTVRKAEESRSKRNSETFDRDDNKFPSDSDRNRREIRSGLPRTQERQKSRPNFDEPWLQAVSRLCIVDDGLPRRLVRLPDGTEISEAKWRREAIQAAGNAVVPSQVAQIMQAIKATDEVI